MQADELEEQRQAEADARMLASKQQRHLQDQLTRLRQESNTNAALAARAEQTHQEEKERAEHEHKEKLALEAKIRMLEVAQAELVKEVSMTREAPASDLGARLLPPHPTLHMISQLY